MVNIIYYICKTLLVEPLLHPLYIPRVCTTCTVYSVLCRAWCTWTDVNRGRGVMLVGTTLYTQCTVYCDMSWEHCCKFSLVHCTCQTLVYRIYSQACIIYYIYNECSWSKACICVDAHIIYCMYILHIISVRLRLDSSCFFPTFPIHNSSHTAVQTVQLYRLARCC